MITDTISKFAKLPDEYDVKARLFPAFLVFLPAAAVVFGVYQAELKLNTAFAALLAYFGVFYLFANMSRELGKRHENRLFAKWGGSPSTQLLRHSNDVIDVLTKARYHRYLEKALACKFPDPSREKAAPADADQIYAGAVRWLLGKTRDKKKFSMLFQENIAYGFRRNCYGSRWVAVVVSLISIAWIWFAEHVVTLNGINVSMLAEMEAGSLTALLVAVGALPVWLFFFTERTVKTASFSYADMLLRSCDVLPKKRSSS